MSPPEPATVRPVWRGRLVVLTGIVLVGLNLRVAVAAVSPILGVVRQDVALAAGVGPLGIGLLYEATGGWDVPIAVLLGLLVVQLATAWRACRPGMLGEPPGRRAAPATDRERVAAGRA